MFPGGAAAGRGRKNIVASRIAVEGEPSLADQNVYQLTLSEFNSIPSPFNANHDPSEQYRCHSCNITVWGFESFEKHTRLYHSTPMSYNCSTCQQSFDFRESLESHIVTHIKSVNKEPPISLESQPVTWFQFVGKNHQQRFETEMSSSTANPLEFRRKRGRPRLKPLPAVIVKNPAASNAAVPQPVAEKLHQNEKKIEAHANSFENHKKWTRHGRPRPPPCVNDTQRPENCIPKRRRGRPRLLHRPPLTNGNLSVENRSPSRRSGRTIVNPFRKPVDSVKASSESTSESSCNPEWMQSGSLRMKIDMNALRREQNGADLSSYGLPRSDRMSQSDLQSSSSSQRSSISCLKSSLEDPVTRPAPEIKNTSVLLRRGRPLRKCHHLFKKDGAEVKPVCNTSGSEGTVTPRRRGGRRNKTKKLINFSGRVCTLQVVEPKLTSLKKRGRPRKIKILQSPEAMSHVHSVLDTRKDVDISVAEVGPVMKQDVGNVSCSDINTVSRSFEARRLLRSASLPNVSSSIGNKQIRPAKQKPSPLKGHHDCFTRRTQSLSLDHRPGDGHLPLPDSNDVIPFASVLDGKVHKNNSEHTLPVADSFLSISTVHENTFKTDEAGILQRKSNLSPLKIKIQNGTSFCLSPTSPTPASTSQVHLSHSSNQTLSGIVAIANPENIVQESCQMEERCSRDSSSPSAEEAIKGCSIGDGIEPATGSDALQEETKPTAKVQKESKICYVCLTFEDNLDEHVLSHCDWKCPKCLAVVSSHEALSEHWIATHAMKTSPYYCFSCQIGHNVYAEYRRHMLSMHPCRSKEGRFMCLFCEKCFMKHSHIKLHWEMCHSHLEMKAITLQAPSSL